MKNFNPRHLRKKFLRKGKKDDDAKQKAFRRAAAWSKRFIHQKASQPEKQSVREHYAEWCAQADKGKLRK